MNNKDASKDLKAVKKILDKLSVRFFLNFGTLIGAVREGNFIKDDKDIDLGILGETKRLLIRRELEKHGFTQNWEENQSVISCKRKVGFDLHFFVDEGGDVLIARAGNKIIIYGYPKKFLTFKEIDFNNDTYLIPLDYDAYLKWLGYSDWRVPSNQTAKYYKL